MKKIMIVTASIAIVGVSAIALASAADAQNKRGHGKGGNPTMLLERYDSNADNSITQKEIDAVRKANIDSHDKSGDDQLTLEEFEGLWLEQSRPMMVRAFQRLDSDGDGQVSEAELSRRTDRLMTMRDLDGDGTLTVDELRPRRGARGDDRGRNR